MCENEIKNKQFNVLDHDHFNGKYQGIAIKNGKKEQEQKIPIFRIKNSETGQILYNMTNFYKTATEKYDPTFNKKKLNNYIGIVDEKQFQEICKS